MVLEEKVKISQVSKFSILHYTQNQELGNLAKFTFNSDFNSSCNFFKNLLERRWSIVSLWLLILSHIFPENFIEISQIFQKIWRFSPSVLTMFINFLGFLTFPVNFVKFLVTPFFQNSSRRLLLHTVSFCK